MSLLIGIKKVKESGTFSGTEGLESIHVKASKVDVIMEGGATQIKHYVIRQRKEEKQIRKRLDVIDDELEDESMGELFYKKLNQESNDLLEKLVLDKYDKLLIVEGVEV